MTQMVARYKTKPEAADLSLRLIVQVFGVLRALSLKDARDLVLQLADDSFLHFVANENEHSDNPLHRLEAFRIFQSVAKKRIADAPQPTKATIVGIYRTDPDEVRAEPRSVLANAPAARTLPWVARRTLYWRTVFPQMTNWSPDKEAAQLRLKFEAEIRRLDAA
jgi:hypothetical protein